MATTEPISSLTGHIDRKNVNLLLLYIFIWCIFLVYKLFKHEIGVLGHSQLLFLHSQLLLDKAPHWQICACATSETPDTPGASDWAWISLLLSKWIADTWAHPSGNNSLFASKGKPIFSASALLIWHMLRICRVRLTVVEPRMEKEKMHNNLTWKALKLKKSKDAGKKPRIHFIWVQPLILLAHSDVAARNR